MSHSISGIVTSFKYKGNLPHVYLVKDYAFIPISCDQEGFRGAPVLPFNQLSEPIRRLLREQSFSGACAYIETDFFGGVGTQTAVVWKNGRIVLGPIASEHLGTISKEGKVVVTLVDEAVNEALKFIGIVAYQGKDEFETAKLHRFRENESALELNA